MRDVIQKIIAAEGEARRIVEEARAEADRILSDAEKTGQSIVEEAQQEALVEAEKILEAALEGAELEKQHLMAQAEERIERETRLSRENRQWAVEGIVRCVCGL